MNIDPTTVTTWPQALVMTAIVIAILVVQPILTHLGNRKIKDVRTTLQETNGGSSVRDSLNRQEKTLAEVIESLALLHSDAMVHSAKSVDNEQITVGNETVTTDDMAGDTPVL